MVHSKFKLYSSLLFLLSFGQMANAQKATALVQTIIKNSGKLYNNPDSSMVVTQKWLEQATQTNDQLASVQAMILQAKIHHQKCEFEQAIQKFERAIAIPVHCQLSKQIIGFERYCF